ncbi:MarR family transcriptional regulator [Actinoplanes sp. NPDC051861]|uniref:MarR family winged helix-turn-helix transcriptional regulator n=1 Tax=Actinoplanes sp. NPDC051861 TaxID=3155170 RepID=UPI0034260E72
MPQETPNVGVLMFVAYREMERRVLDAVVAAGYDVTLAQARIFQRIGPDGTRLVELADQAQVTKQTAGFLVDQLERAGFVERVADPTDGRARLVRIAERGRRAGEIAAGVVAEVEAEWVAHLGKRRMGQLRDTLTKLREITDPYAR